MENLTCTLIHCDQVSGARGCKLVWSMFHIYSCRSHQQLCKSVQSSPVNGLMFKSNLQQCAVLEWIKIEVEVTTGRWSLLNNNLLGKKNLISSLELVRFSLQTTKCLICHTIQYLIRNESQDTLFLVTVTSLILNTMFWYILLNDSP